MSLISLCSELPLPWPAAQVFPEAFRPAGK